MTIQVGDLVNDPDFATTFSVIRRTESIDSYGVSSLTTTTFNNVTGVITAEGEPLAVPMAQEEDSTYARQTLIIYTQFRLYDPLTGYQPDLVVYFGNTYMIHKVTNYSTFGYYRADCLMVNLEKAINQ